MEDPDFVANLRHTGRKGPFWDECTKFLEASVGTAIDDRLHTLQLFLFGSYTSGFNFAMLKPAVHQTGQFNDSSECSRGSGGKITLTVTMQLEFS